VRLISNLETDTEKLIQIVLVGQPEFRAMLAVPSCASSRSESLRATTWRTQSRECEAYVRHRLAVAGVRARSFTAGALTGAQRVSGGRRDF